jgi:hypothetical protein
MTKHGRRSSHPSKLFPDKYRSRHAARESRNSPSTHVERKIHKDNRHASTPPLYITLCSTLVASVIILIYGLGLATLQKKNSRLGPLGGSGPLSLQQLLLQPISLHAYKRWRHTPSCGGDTHIHLTPLRHHTTLTSPILALASIILAGT